MTVSGSNPDVRSIHEVLRGLLDGERLSEASAESVFERLFAGEFEEAQIAGLLSLIQARGATVEELTGAARVMRRHATPVPTPKDPRASVIDTCGTGGAPKTFNISTASAIVAAAASPHHTESGGARVLVAKHGNRSRTGRGSAEVLAALGVNIDAPPEVQGRCLEEAGVCFCFAIRHHPAAKHAAAVRRALAFPTMFNVLGPLTNPGGATRQLMGIYDRSLVEKAAGVLASLGSVRAMVVHGDDGLDEISLTGGTTVGHVRDGAVSMERIEASDHGLETCSLDELRETDIEGCARIVRQIVENDVASASRAKFDAVLLNAGAALVVAGACRTLRDGIERARMSVECGRAMETLERLVRTSQGA